MKTISLLLIFLMLGCTAQVVNIQNETSAADFALNNKDFSNFLIANGVTNKTLTGIEYVKAEEKSASMKDELAKAYLYIQDPNSNRNIVLNYMRSIQDNIDIINQAGDYWFVVVSGCSIYFRENGTVLSYSFINGIDQEVKFHCLN